MDLQVEKTLVSNGNQSAIFYVEVFNLFDQKDSTIPYNYPDYVRWGLNEPRPDDASFQEYGDYNELDRFVGSPREVGLGFKLNF